MTLDGCLLNCRTRQMCLLWVIPMRDLLPLLRRNPALYHKAVQQAVPAVPFDYLAINPIGVGYHLTYPSTRCCLPVCKSQVCSCQCV